MTNNLYFSRLITKPTVLPFLPALVSPEVLAEVEDLVLAFPLSYLTAQDLSLVSTPSRSSKFRQFDRHRVDYLCRLQGKSY